MNIANGTFRQFGKRDGIKGVSFNENSAFKASDGKLYFGSTNGVYSFYPNNIVSNYKAPEIVFTKLELFNKEIKPNDKSGILTKSINQTGTLNLNFKQNGISIEFVAINYTNTQKNQYAYFLEGLDKEWMYSNGNRKVVYNNLAPGSYTFKVKASNNDGVWNNTGRELSILISPPWHKTWLALSFFVLLLLLVVVLINRYVLRQFRLQDALKIEKIEKENQIAINDLKTQFFMNITHEFKTPLTLIISPLEKMIAGTKNNNQKKLLVLMERNAHRLLRLIDQLMEFRKIELGKSRLELKHVELVNFIEETILPFHGLAEEGEISIQFHNKPDYLNWWCDPDKLEKVIYNLLSNAFKHTPKFGCVEITLSENKNPVSESIDSVQIKVTNNGPGIPEEEQKTIFDRFSRLKNDSTTGTGLGLSLSKGFVEMHGGSIQVDSQPNKGSTFTIQLPMMKGPTGATNSNQPNDLNIIDKKAIDLNVANFNPPKYAIEDESANEKQFKILIVEDEKDVREFIVEILNPYFEVAQANDGKEGVDLALEILPDLIVSDVLMPNVDGIELCTTLKTNISTSHIPIILLTALSSEEQQIKGLNTGADDYISKPFNANTLIYKIRGIIENRRKIANRFRTEMAIEPKDIVVHSADEELITNTINIIKQHISDVEFSVDKLVEELGMSRSAFFRKIKAVTLMSPNELIRTIRLKHAAELLLKSDLNISEISYEVGFVSPKYFRECFKKQFDVTPSEYKEIAR
jgi:signal transduction histidine kinase/DNA-binding response OmpR family regulator